MVPLIRSPEHPVLLDVRRVASLAGGGGWQCRDGAGSRRGLWGAGNIPSLIQMLGVFSWSCTLTIRTLSCGWGCVML